MAEQTNDSGGTCANCGTAAITKCGHCKEAYYCNKVCQKAHWKAHKKVCNIDKYIHRVGKLYKDLVLMWAEKTYCHTILKVEDGGKDILVHDGPSQPGNFRKFPGHLFRDDRDRMMLLTNSICVESMAYFTDIVDEMMKGTGCKMQEVVVKMKPPVRRARIIAIQGEIPGDNWMTHELPLVTSHDGSKQWVFDPAGAQFSQFEPVVDWNKYKTENVKEVRRLNMWAAAKKELVGFAKEEGNWGLVPRIGWDSVKFMNRAVREWKADSGMTIPKLLRESDAVFKEQRASLMKGVGAALDDFVAKADYRRDIAAAEEWEKRNHLAGLFRTMGLNM